jgi:hypothetical protein
LAEAADVCEMVNVKNIYIYCFKYVWYYCFIGGFAATCGWILVKRKLTENCEGGRWGMKVEMSFHYSVSRFFIGEIRTEDRCFVVYMVLKRRDEDEEGVKSWE